MSSQLVTATLNADEDDINRQISQQSFLLDKSQTEHASSHKRLRRCRHHHHQHYHHQLSARLRLRQVTAINCCSAAIRALTRMRLFIWAQNREWPMTVRIISCLAVLIRQWTR